MLKSALFSLLACLLIPLGGCNRNSGHDPYSPYNFLLTVNPNATDSASVNGCDQCKDIPLDIWIDGQLMGSITKPTTFVLSYDGAEYVIQAGSTKVLFRYAEFEGGVYEGILEIVRCGCQTAEGGDCARVKSLQSAFQYKLVECAPIQ